MAQNPEPTPDQIESDVEIGAEYFLPDEPTEDVLETEDILDAEIVQPVSKTEKSVERRFELPLTLWNEILAISQETETNQHDTVAALLDMGLQAHEEGRLKPRWFGVDSGRMAAIDKTAHPGEDIQAAMIRVLDLGLLQFEEFRSKTGGGAILPKPKTKTPVRIQKTNGTKLADVEMTTVPGPGEYLVIGGKTFVIENRIWLVSGNSCGVRLDVKPFLRRH